MQNAKWKAWAEFWGDGMVKEMQNAECRMGGNCEFPRKARNTPTRFSGALFFSVVGFTWI
jgi:hypothetical protein